MQTSQLETGAWLTTAQESIGELRERMAQLDDLTANVDHMRRNADRVIAAAYQLEQREPSLTELDDRVSELRAIGTKLDERTSNLLASLSDADRRFEAVAAQAAEADKVHAVIEEVTASVRKAENRMEGLEEGVDTAGRARRVHQVALGASGPRRCRHHPETAGA
jgi:predicted RNase H-like nuclease (RuvC/YqgF family)